MSDASTNVVVARSARGLTGFGIMKYLDDEAHLLLLAVHASQRRVGAGTALLNWLLTTAEVAGAATVTLELRASNAAAMRFYELHGFEVSRREPGYYSGLEDAVRMVRRLRPLEARP
jgi:ribosomal-protein-alanine N-acetyltransferase